MLEQQPAIDSIVSNLDSKVLIVRMVKRGEHEVLCAEEKRLKEDKERKKYWKRWGPYLSERQWATGMLPEQRGVGELE